MGSDPQSHLEIMHRIEHEECRTTEADLKLRLKGSCEDAMNGFSVLADVIEQQRSDNRDVQGQLQTLCIAIEAAIVGIARVDQTGYYHKIVTDLQATLKNIK